LSFYLIPRPHLPLTQPLRDLGVKPEVVDRLDDTLRPIVDAGYSRLTPDLGPHLDSGRLVFSARRMTRNTRASEAPPLRTRPNRHTSVPRPKRISAVAHHPAHDHGPVGHSRKMGSKAPTGR